ncbi:MAG: GNAT family N-acetyltransferase [Actinobacteria bacterium]|nr:GNAT family N-acetyltransferase [Actinomycetota bacterium]
MPVHESLHVRPAVAEDSMAVAQAHVRSWQVGYRGLLPIGYLDTLRPEDRASRYGFDKMNPNGPFTQVAIDRGTVCGHVTTGRCRDSDLQGGGEIWALYVDPERWGFGIGRCLITAGCAQLTSQGYDTASLWVLSGNDRARRFYERAGWHCDGAERTDSIGDHAVHEVRYQRVLQTSPSQIYLVPNHRWCPRDAL